MLWQTIALAMIIGVVGGFFIGRLTSSNHRQKLRLEAELKEVKTKLAQHHAQVTEHFTKTASLIQQMTESYQTVFQHLADGADTLCTNNPNVGRLFHAKPEETLYKVGHNPDAEATTKAPNNLTETPKDYVL